jgi:hypothetical protein
MVAGLAALGDGLYSRLECGFHPDVQAAKLGCLPGGRMRRHGKEVAIPRQFDPIAKVEFRVIRESSESPVIS